MSSALSIDRDQFMVEKPGKAGDPVMRGPKPDPLSLSKTERTELERFVRRHSTGQQMALRGRII